MESGAGQASHLARHLVNRRGDRRKLHLFLFLDPVRNVLHESIFKYAMMLYCKDFLMNFAEEISSPFYAPNKPPMPKIKPHIIPYAATIANRAF